MLLHTVWYFYKHVLLRAKYFKIPDKKIPKVRYSSAGLLIPEYFTNI